MTICKLGVQYHLLILALEVDTEGVTMVVGAGFSYTTRTVDVESLGSGCEGS